MLSDQHRTRILERALREALLRSQFDLHYQPIYDVDGATLIAFESLIRWSRPDGAQISPAEFIPIAEQSDLIDKIGAWVLRRACRDIGALRSRYIGVNVSAAELRNSRFAAGFAAILDQYSVTAEQITVEITETVPLDSDGPESANLHALRDLGCWVAMDDFGVGHATFASLRKFPFNVVKIDKSYIGRLMTDPESRLLVRRLCDFGRRIGMVVVAEGVETREQLRALADLGCSRVQGYLLGRPAPVTVWAAPSSAFRSERVA